MSVRSIIRSTITRKRDVPKYIWRPRYWACAVLGGVAVLLAGYEFLTQEYLPEMYRRRHPYILWVTWSLYIAILMVWLPIEISRVHRKERLHNNLCRTCGYDLRKLIADRCPECGCPDLAESRRQLEETYGVFWIGALFRAYFSRRKKQEAEG